MNENGTTKKGSKDIPAPTAQERTDAEAYDDGLNTTTLVLGGIAVALLGAGSALLYYTQDDK